MYGLCMSHACMKSYTHIEKERGGGVNVRRSRGKGVNISVPLCIAHSNQGKSGRNIYVASIYVPHTATTSTAKCKQQILFYHIDLHFARKNNAEHVVMQCKSMENYRTIFHGRMQMCA